MSSCTPRFSNLSRRSDAYDRFFSSQFRLLKNDCDEADDDSLSSEYYDDYSSHGDASLYDTHIESKTEYTWAQRKKSLLKGKETNDAITTKTSQNVVNQSLGGFSL